MDRTDDDNFTRDEKVPAVCPRDHAVVGQLVQDRREHDPRPLCVALESELPACQLQVFRDCGNRLVYREDQIPQRACDDQKNCRQLNSDRAAAENPDEEKHCGWEKTQHGHRLKDVRRRKDEPSPALVCCSQVTRKYADNQREDHRGDHPPHRRHGVKGQISEGNVQRRLFQRVNLRAVTEQDNGQSDDQKPDADIYWICRFSPHRV